MTRFALLALLILGCTRFSSSANDDLWLHPKLRPLSSDKLGPFVHTSNGDILAIDTAATFVSSDNGKTWSDPRPVFGSDQTPKFKSATSALCCAPATGRLLPRL